MDGDARADVVVVGGGITGLSAALHLAEGGAVVRVLEAEEPGWGASGRNGGQVNPGLKHDPDVVERDFGPDLGGRMNALAGNAPGLVFDLIERHGIDCEARRNGTLRAVVRERYAADLRATVDQWQRRGAPVEFVGSRVVAELTGTERYHAAMFDRRGGDVNPLSYARGLARAALRAGAAVHGTTRVLRLEAAGSQWRVGTSSGTVTARQVVLAGNGYTDDLWPGLRRSVVPVFSSIAATAPLTPPLERTVMPGRAVLYESGAVTVYYRVDAGGRLLMGGRGPQRSIAAPQALRHLRDYATRLWPGLADVRWTHAWSGRLAMTRDQYPHVHEPAPGILAGLGYNGRGVAMATALGRQLALRLLGSQPIDMPISKLQPIRLHALWPLVVRATIARSRIADRLGR